ncbi:MAG: sulfatase-like hydrolase/transferase, partial [Candidatus Binatia bacterium]
MAALLVSAGAIVFSRRSELGDRPRRPNILLVTIDTLRADHCSTYGYARPTTPRLSELAASGVRFEVAYAPMATTGPSHGTMFTSLLPRSHGVLKNGLTLSDRPPTLAAALLAAGYRTAAVVSSYAVHRRFGLGRGFLTYDDDFTGARPSLTHKVFWEGHEVPGPFDRRADETRAKAVDWLERQGYLEARRSALPPFFLWVHFFDPHSPYDPPEPHRGRFALPSRDVAELDREIAAYDGEAHFADEEMG